MRKTSVPRSRSPHPGKRRPLPPPLIDFVVAAYGMAAVFDVVSAFGRRETFANAFFRAGTYALIGGVAVSALAAFTGLRHWLRSTGGSRQVRHGAMAHAWTIAMVTAVAAIDTALRLSVYHTRTHPTVTILVLSIGVAALVSSAAVFSEALRYDYRFEREAVTHLRVRRQSKTDILPRDHTD